MRLCPFGKKSHLSFDMVYFDAFSATLTVQCGSLTLNLDTLNDF